MAAKKQIKKANGRGRPTICTKAISDEICQKLADGLSLRQICSPSTMPNKSSVLLWVVNGRTIEGTDIKFSDQYRRAREAAGYSHADEALDLRHDVRNGNLEPAQAKVILDALKWGAERMASKSHSARQEIDHTTKGESLNRQASEYSDDELAAMLASDAEKE